MQCTCVSNACKRHDACQNTICRSPWVVCNNANRCFPSIAHRSADGDRLSSHAACHRRSDGVLHRGKLQSSIRAVAGCVWAQQPCAGCWQRQAGDQPHQWQELRLWRARRQHDVAPGEVGRLEPSGTAAYSLMPRRWCNITQLTAPHFLPLQELNPNKAIVGGSSIVPALHISSCRVLMSAFCTAGPAACQFATPGAYNTLS